MHLYSERVNETVLVGFFECMMGGGRWKECKKMKNIEITHLYLNINIM
jgi:hypothetical protein